eukprot:753453-Hanusia_phi.AAC.2
MRLRSFRGQSRYLNANSSASLCRLLAGSALGKQGSLCSTLGKSLRRLRTAPRNLEEPPGSGKPTTTLSFIQPLAWGREGGNCVYGFPDQVQSDFLHVIDGKERVVQTDMVRAAHTLFLRIDRKRKQASNIVGMASCRGYRDVSRENRWLVVSTAIFSRKDLSRLGQARSAKELKVPSWTLGEDVEAFKNDLLYNSAGLQCVEFVLEHGGGQLGRGEGCRVKVSDSWGSCRLMFESTAQEAIASAQEAMRLVRGDSTLSEILSGPRLTVPSAPDLRISKEPG